MTSCIRQFHDGVRAYVRLDDRVCSRWFAVEQSLRQGCALAPLLINIFSAVVINVASTRFKADKGITDDLEHLRKKRGAGGRGETTAGESVLATPLWGMLYADDAAVVSRSSEKPRKTMGVTVVVSKAKTEIMCLRAKGMPESTAIQRRGSGSGVQPDKRVCIPRGKRQRQCRPVYRGRPAHTQRMMQLPEVHPRTVRPTERSPRAQNTDAKSRGPRDMLYNCVTWSPRACHHDTLRRAHHRFLTRCIGWRTHNRADHPISYLDTLIKTGSESIEATLRRRRILFAGFVARMEDTRLPKCVIFGQLVGGAGCVGARKKSGWGVSWTTSELSASKSTSGRLQPRTRGNGAEREDKGRNIAWQNGSLQKKPRLDYGMQSYART